MNSDKAAALSILKNLPSHIVQSLPVRVNTIDGILQVLSTYTTGDALVIDVQPLSPPVKTWNGTEDGLPPVGLEVEAYFPEDTQPQWLKTTFLYVSDHVVVYTDVFDEIHKSRTEFDKLDVRLRPIRTAEQLAAEERERVAEEMVRRFALHGVDAPWKGLFLQMYDCGVLKP